MQYRIEFFDDGTTVVHVVDVEARSHTTAFLRGIEQGWPPDAFSACVVNPHGRRSPPIFRPQLKAMRQAEDDV